ncbi:MAG: sulfatase-like hydrolase/transferase [Bryobacterales bacterium]|nr:sulfatase-like hydrolase/transferase [Bryobacterales bacterium]
MNRREHLKALAGAAAGLAAPAQTGTQPPNILFLFTDDQRFSTLHALNNPEVKTPTMDALVARGTAFTRAGIMGGTIPAVCAPSRGMLMTGQTLFHVHHNLIDPKSPPEKRRPYHMWPEVLRQRGYETFSTGKWHNGEKTWARCFSQGENIFFGGMSDHLHVPVADFDPTGEYPKSKRHIAKGFSTEIFSDSAIRFLKNHKSGKPFALYLPYTSPHDPRMAPKDFADLYSPDKITLPKNFLPEHPFDNGEMKIRDEALAPWPRTPEVVREHIAAYYAMITHVDYHMGRVLKALEESGHAGNTIVVFSADNGLAVGQHGLLGKQNLYEHSMRVPLVIGGAGLPRGKRTDAYAYLYDLFPTLCDLTGTATPDTVEGSSLAPVIRGHKDKVRDSMFSAYRTCQRAVKGGRYKLIRYNVNGARTTQLFDLQEDPLEMRNLAGDAGQKHRIGGLNSLLGGWMRKTEDIAPVSDFVA